VSEAGPDAASDTTNGVTNEDLPLNTAIDNANDNAAFLAGDDISPEQNTAAGLGGTIGSEADGTWTQGESAIVQLDRPLLFEGERVTVQIIDRETNSLVLDRTVRIQDTERFQFVPDSEMTVVDDSEPDTNISINDSVNVSDGDLGDLPSVPPTAGDGPDDDTVTPPSSNDDDDTIGGTDDPDSGTDDTTDPINRSPNNDDLIRIGGTDDNDDENDEKTFVEPGFTRKSTNAASGQTNSQDLVDATLTDGGRGDRSSAAKPDLGDSNKDRGYHDQNTGSSGSSSGRSSGSPSGPADAYGGSDSGYAKPKM